MEPSEHLWIEISRWVLEQRAERCIRIDLTPADDLSDPRQKPLLGQIAFDTGQRGELVERTRERYAFSA